MSKLATDALKKELAEAEGVAASKVTAKKTVATEAKAKVTGKTKPVKELTRDELKAEAGITGDTTLRLGDISLCGPPIV